MSEFAGNWKITANRNNWFGGTALFKKEDTFTIVDTSATTASIAMAANNTGKLREDQDKNAPSGSLKFNENSTKALGEIVRTRKDGSPDSERYRLLIQIDPNRDPRGVRIIVVQYPQTTSDDSGGEWEGVDE